MADWQLRSANTEKPDYREAKPQPTASAVVYPTRTGRELVAQLETKQK